jgi:hypothetical protein
MCCLTGSSTFAVTACPPIATAQETSSLTEDYRDRYQRLTGRSLRDCPACGKGHMVCIETFLPGALPRAPPHIHHAH